MEPAALAPYNPVTTQLPRLASATADIFLTWVSAPQPAILLRNGEMELASAKLDIT